MIIDDKGRLFRKINLIDLLIILIVIAAGIFVFGKYGKAKIMTPFDKQEPIIITFAIEGLPEYAADSISDGDTTIDKVSSSVIGKVVKGSIQKDPDIFYAPDQNGIMIRSSRDGYCSLTFSVEGTGKFIENGVNVSNTEYYIYRPTDVRVGYTILYTRIKDIKRK